MYYFSIKLKMWLSGELPLISHEFKQPDNSVFNYIYFDNQKLVSLFFNKSKIPQLLEDQMISKRHEIEN